MRYQKIIILFVLFITLFNFNCSKGKGISDYNTVVDYEKGIVLYYPDFNLEYIDERNEKKDFPNGNTITFKFFDYKISNDKESKTISWSFGTGDIAPTEFEFDGKKYQLEMSNSESLKLRLKKNELVIVKK